MDSDLIHMYMHTYIYDTCTHTYMYRIINVNLPRYLLAYLHTYIHT